MAKRSRVEKAIRVLRGVEVLQSQGVPCGPARDIRKENPP